MIPLSPHEARLRDETYSSAIYVDVEETYTRAGRPQARPVTHQKVFLGKVPMMVRSHYCYLSDKTPQERMDLLECPLDPGGYFIVNGSEKVRKGVNFIKKFRFFSSKLLLFSTSTHCAEHFPPKINWTYLFRLKNSAGLFFLKTSGWRVVIGFLGLVSGGGGPGTPGDEPDLRAPGSQQKVFLCRADWMRGGKLRQTVGVSLPFHYGWR